MAAADFQFVTVQADTSKRNSRPWVDQDERRKVRVTVMRNHVRQQKDPGWRFSPAALSSDRKLHMARFRPVSQCRHNASRYLKVDARSPRESSASLKHLRFDKDDSKTKDQVLRIHGLGGIDPFSIVPVDMSDPETMTLMEYYFKSYWSNSLAVNPNGGWTLVALRDKAIIHAKLSLVAIHKADRVGGPPSPAYLKHRGQALRLIGERLNEGDVLTDELIGAVSILSSSDYHSDWPDEVLDSHANGIAALVGKRGGIDSPIINTNVARVVAWLDLLHAALREHPVLFGRSKHAQEADLPELTHLTGKPYTTSPEQRESVQRLPPPVRSVFRQLRILGEIRSALSIEQIPEVCEMFSSMVWNVEYDILDLNTVDEDLQQHRWGDANIFDYSRTFTVLRDAFLIYSYIAFRDQNSTALYRRLSSRLEHNFFGLIESLPSLRAVSSNELVLLLWVLLTAWKGATLARRPTSRLSSKAAEVCRVLMTGREDVAAKQVQDIVWDEENDTRLFPKFWAELKGARAG